jgi:arylsulfatase A-like enzyme
MANEKPNLLIIHTDQQSWWTLGCYGGTAVDTPNIDRLAADGALYSNFFTNSGVCTPSRGCFMIGRYPHSNGAYTNNVTLNRDEITFAEVLKRNGYRTGYAGKWHLDGTPRPGWVHPHRAMGFEDARFMFNRGHLFETAYRIPLLIHWPAGIAPGTRVDNVLSTVDFQPTILSLMGVSCCGREQGRNGVGLLQGHDNDWDDSAFLYHNSHGYAGVFTPFHELVLAKEGDSILFDRQSDPDQPRNLFADPDHSEIRDLLARRVIQHNNELGSPAAEWLSRVVSTQP